jgi:hypothetical protein
MNRRTFAAGLALMSVALAGPACSGEDQPPARELAPFKATLTGSPRDFLIPLDPPIVASNLDARGQADFLGACTSTEHFLVHLSADGVRPTAIADGIAVIAAPNGDAIFVRYSGLPRPPAAGEWSRGEEGFTIVGGRGRFAGATGSGTAQTIVKGVPRSLQITRTFEGMISRPAQ